MKKKEVKGWYGDTCHYLLIELNLLAKDLSCSDQLIQSEGTEIFHTSFKIF